MNNRASGFVVDGLRRLLRSPEYLAKCKAIEAQVREEHAAELAATSDYWSRVAIQEQIEREIQRRLKFILAGNEPGNPAVPASFDAQGARQVVFTLKQ
jgi:hypothetical protein